MIMEISPFVGNWPRPLRKYYMSLCNGATIDEFNDQLHIDGYNIKLTAVHLQNNDNEEVMLTGYNLDFASDADYILFMLKWS